MWHLTFSMQTYKRLGMSILLVMLIAIVSRYGGPFQQKQVIAMPLTSQIVIVPAVSAWEEPCGESYAVFGVTMIPATDVDVTVWFSIEPGVDDPATPYEDYLPPLNNFIVFPAGTTSQTIDVQILCDGVNEPRETFIITLTDAQPADKAQIDPAQKEGIGHIIDSDTPELSINDVAVYEGDEGLVEAVLNITLDIEAYRDVEVHYVTLPGTATPWEDYQPISGDVTMPAGTVVVPISVNIIGDYIDEEDETFILKISPTRGEVSVGKSEGVVTILDDDQAGLTWEPQEMLVTSEWGDSATFSVMLTSQPVAPVVIAVASSDPGEGLPDTDRLDFDSENWNVPQAVRVTGVDDFVCDGDKDYAILLNASPSSDGKYQALGPSEVRAINLDDETECLYLPLSGMQFNPPLYVFEAFESVEAVRNWEVIATEGQGAVVSPDGKYILEQRRRNYNVKGIAPIAGIYRDYAVEVIAQVVDIADQMTRYGIIFDWLDNDRFYRFIIEEENGLYAIQKWQNGWVFLTNGWEPTTILQTQPGPYRLRVERRGAEIQVFINGQRPNLTPIFDTTYRYGGAGVIMIAQPDLPEGGLAAASFDDFLVIGLDD